VAVTFSSAKISPIHDATDGLAGLAMQARASGRRRRSCDRQGSPSTRTEPCFEASVKSRWLTRGRVGGAVEDYLVGVGADGPVGRAGEEEPVAVPVSINSPRSGEYGCESPVMETPIFQGQSCWTATPSMSEVPAGE
jgi:hypothetical protein